MLSIGWPEMMVVAAAALIIIGPRDLPAMLRRLGQAMGTVRRMGNDFKAEINKVAALDDVKDIKNSMSLPFTEAKANINKEFNKMNPVGSDPLGSVATKTPRVENAYDKTKAAVGKSDTAKAKAKQMAATKAKAKTKTTAKASAAKPATSKKSAASKKPATRKTTTPAKAKAAVTKVAPAKSKPAAKKVATKKPATAKTTRKPRPTKVS